MHPPTRTGYLWFAFVASAMVTIGLFFIPAFIIQPFRHQAPNALGVALALRQHAPWGTLIAAVICLIFAVVLWGMANRWRRVVIGLVMAPVVFSAVMARMNYFEWMFHPVNSPQFEAESASRLDPGEMILAVRFGADARAYPIREMAYHHVLNDIIGGAPVAVTY